MSHCPHDNDTLTLYFDGELPDDRARAVEDHLKVCSACRGEILRLADFDRLLARLPEPIVSPGFVDRTLDRILRIERLRRVVVTRAIPAAAAVLICLLGARLYFLGDSPEPASPAVVRNRQLVENLEVVQHYDMLQEFALPENASLEAPKDREPATALD